MRIIDKYTEAVTSEQTKLDFICKANDSENQYSRCGSDNQGN